MSIKVSVIIPVYNAEPYLAECIESLLRQTLPDCEYIFVNDGSNDDSDSIIRHYCGMHSNMKLIEQMNHGVSVARNVGLLAAQGEYIGFVDADDYVEPDFYEKLYRAAKEEDDDAAICNFQSVLEGCSLTIEYPFPSEERLDRRFIEEQLLPYFVKTDNLNSVVNKLYRKQVIEDHRIRFTEKMALGEDGLFNMQYFSKASSVRYIRYTGYHYREVEGSATRNMASKDYFGRALESYAAQLPSDLTGRLSQTEIKLHKSIKLVECVLAYIYMYSKASSDFSLSQRMTYIRNMIRHEEVRKALPIYCAERYHSLGRYEKFMVEMMKRRSVIGLFAASTYSRIRNAN